MAGVVADVATHISGSDLYGYLIVFGIEALMLLVASILLTRIDVAKFKKKVEEPSFTDKIAITAE
jgi:BCD family chlorophyll transporter-like MFS transporter